MQNNERLDIVLRYFLIFVIYLLTRIDGTCSLSYSLIKSRMGKRIQEVTTEAEKRELVQFSPCFFRLLSPVNEPINIHHFELPCDSRARD